MSDLSFLAAILLFERGCLQLELSCCRTPHPYLEFVCLAQTVLSLKQEPIDYQPRSQGAEASEKRPEDEVARLYQEPITVITHLAWSRRSDSRARRSIRSELNCTPGKRGASSLALAPPSPVFPVYNLTRFLLTAALFYLKAWNRLQLIVHVLDQRIV